MSSIWDGVVVGGAGGAVAGVTVWLVQLIHQKYAECRDRKKIHDWLKDNTSNETEKCFRSTRAIASWTNLTEDRVRHMCSVDDRIYLSTGDREEMWTLYEVRARS